MSMNACCLILATPSHAMSKYAAFIGSALRAWYTRPHAPVIASLVGIGLGRSIGYEITMDTDGQVARKERIDKTSFKALARNAGLGLVCWAAAPLGVPYVLSLATRHLIYGPKRTVVFALPTASDAVEVPVSTPSEVPAQVPATRDTEETKAKVE
jgi:hypothetical protein